MIKKLTLSFTLSLFIILNAATAKAWHWDGSNTIMLDDYNVQISRPNDRWRILDKEYPELVEMRFNQSGMNASIILKDLRVSMKPLSKFRHTKMDQETEILLAPYENEGFQFYLFKNKNGILEAKGTNSDRDILLLYFLKKNLKSNHDWFVLEMKFPRESYLDLEEEFETTKLSLKNL